MVKVALIDEDRICICVCMYVYMTKYVETSTTDGKQPQRTELDYFL